MSTAWVKECQERTISKGLSLESIVEKFTGASFEQEKFIDGAFVDLYQELPTEKFIEAFGERALNSKTRNDSQQKLVIEVQGKLHDCGPSGDLNLKTTGKLYMLQELGINTSYIKSADMHEASKMNEQDCASFIQKLLQKRMNSQ